MDWLGWLYYLLLLLVAVSGIFLSILGLPGLWLMVIGLATFGWLTTWNHYVGSASLWTLFGLAVVAEIAEFAAGSVGAKRAGGSRSAMAGAVVGALLGGIFFTFIPIPIVGTIAGVCLGAFAGASVIELAVRDDVSHSLKVGTGAAVGRFAGIMIKLAFGMAMLIVTMIAALPVG